MVKKALRAWLRRSREVQARSGFDRDRAGGRATDPTTARDAVPFFSLLELDDDIQRKDIEGIEHHLSRETVQALEDLATFFESRPELLKKFLNGRTPAE